MEASRRHDGIQLLLTVEQEEAQHIVNVSRNAKMAKLKQDKEEAEKENAELRAQMEVDFQRNLAEGSGNSDADAKRLEKETAAKIHHLKVDAARMSHDIVQMLLNMRLI